MSMKFLLILQVCSFLSGECAAPVQSPHFYNSWYDCASAAHLNGLKLLQHQGSNNVNNYKLVIKYGCHPTTDL